MLEGFLGGHYCRGQGLLGDPWDPEVILWRPHYLKPHLIPTLWLGCRVKAHSKGKDDGRGERNAEVTAVTRPCLVPLCSCVYEGVCIVLHY